jgi:hypothetical protein
MQAQLPRPDQQAVVTGSFSVFAGARIGLFAASESFVVENQLVRSSPQVASKVPVIDTHS